MGEAPSPDPDQNPNPCAMARASPPPPLAAMQVIERVRFQYVGMCGCALVCISQHLLAFRPLARLLVCSALVFGASSSPGHFCDPPALV